jgi:hypothetical protein
VRDKLDPTTEKLVMVSLVMLLSVSAIETVPPPRDKVTLLPDLLRVCISFVAFESASLTFRLMVLPPEIDIFPAAPLVAKVWSSDAGSPAGP